MSDRLSALPVTGAGRERHHQAEHFKAAACQSSGHGAGALTPRLWEHEKPQACRGRRSRYQADQTRPVVRACRERQRRPMRKSRGYIPADNANSSILKGSSRRPIGGGNGLMGRIDGAAKGVERLVGIMESHAVFGGYNVSNWPTCRLYRRRGWPARPFLFSSDPGWHRDGRVLPYSPC